MTRAALWIGGEPPAVEALLGLPEFDLVIAADSGLDAAVAADVVVDVLVGDLDSVDPACSAAFGGETVRFPPDKDFTDLELALDVAMERGATQLVVIGGGGGRLDHEISSLLVLTLDKYDSCEIEARIGKASIAVVREGSPAGLQARPGEVVSLVPVSDVVNGVTTSGLRWPLTEAVLTRGATWSVSNEFVSANASVEISDGALLTIQPAAFSPPNT